jgi:hypothetical protein
MYGIASFAGLENIPEYTINASQLANKQVIVHWDEELYPFHKSLNMHNHLRWVKWIE